MTAPLAVAQGGGGGCSPDLPEACSEAVTCGATMDDFNDPHFQVEFLSRTYDAMADETTFVYLICRLQDAPNLSHWVLGLCDDLRLAVVDSSGGTADTGPVDPDPTTCLEGWKFDTSGGVPLCDDTCPAGSSTGGVFSVTLSGDVPTAIVPAGVTIATKAGQVEDDICLEGPSCDPVVTTTTTSSSTSTTTEDTLETTTTTSSTTSTLPDCGDGDLDPGEQCDPPGSLTCPPSTPEGAFLECDAACQCPAEETTTTTSSSSTTSSSTAQVTTTSTSSTSTTLQCDEDPDCDDGDVCTEDVCTDDGTCEHTDVPPSGTEDVCNDMVDNDCDGLVDCDDPDCSGIDECPTIKKDPSKIIFGGPGELDQFKSHGRVEPGAAIDVGTVEVGWMISGPNGPIYRAALIPGDFRPNTKNTTFRFLDRGAREGGGKRFGVYKAKIRISRGGTSYGYKIQAYGDFSGATMPDMAIQFYVGDQVFIHDQPWTQTSYGWKATAFE